MADARAVAMEASKTPEDLRQEQIKAKIPDIKPYM